MSGTDVADPDVWYDWLTTTRHGGDAEYAAAQRPQIEAIRDGVLAGLRLSPQARVADVGCGDGLMGLEVLRRMPQASVIFTDVSPALVERTRRNVAAMGALKRASFAVHSAESMTSIPDGSVDVVLVRAVLAYVRDKRAAAMEFRRVLKPAGRISLADPIFQDKALLAAGLGARLGARRKTDGEERAADYSHRVLSAQFPSTLSDIERDPLVNYNERTLLCLFEECGFVEIRLRLHVDVVAAPAMPWRAFLDGAPRAGVPTVRRILDTRFSDVEREAFERIFRPAIESGTAIERNVIAYLQAEAPA